MKFGTQLKESLYQSWKFYYMDYDGLKRLLKTASQQGHFTENHESKFVETLESELDKVATFCSTKGEELVRRIQHCESTVENILKEDLSSEANSSSRFARVEEEISQITSDVAELSKYTRLNYSGFLKIIKKHDKHTEFKLKPLFMVRLAARPFYKQSFDSLIIRLSKLYDVVRTGGKRADAKPPSGGNFIRRTTKYWVHPDNVTEVKIHILRHLPVLVFPSKSGQEPDPAISSVYFDNDALELYLGRLEKTEGAQAVRLRWYGNMDQNEIFVERKTHKEDWTGEHSVKSRFAVKEKYVNAYLAGEYTMDRVIQKMRDRKQKPEKELDEMQVLASEVQATIKDKGLKPLVRTFYNRTAFQLPGDARVRISLDTELTMIREDNYERDRSGPNWRRLDAGTIAPFTHLPEEDVCPFPYAVLEVKLQTQHGTEAPQWVQDLVNSHLVEEVPKFSKFIHGTATLLENRVPLLPFWLPQMDRDIRKAPNGVLKSITRSPSSTAPLQKAPEAPKDQIEVVVDGEQSYKVKNKGKKPVKEEDDDDDDDDLHATETTSLLRRPAGNTSKDSAAALARKRAANAGGFKIWESMFGAPRYAQVQAGGSTNAIPTQFRDKRIALPVRVEPKVFFANERTFLSWLHFCIVLGTLAVGLVNFGDSVGQISGAIFTGIAMLFMFYALFLYQWRAHKIRIRDPGPYDDRVGPTVLVIVLFVGILINFVLKFTQKKPVSP